MEIEHVTPLDPLDVAARMDELKLLHAGWLDGNGQALDRAGLDRLTNAFTTHYPDNLPLPYTFPTESGNIQFEWRLGSSAPEIEIDLATLKGEWVSDDEASIELSTSEGWSDLASRILALVRANHRLGRGRQ